MQPIEFNWILLTHIIYSLYNSYVQQGWHINVYWPWNSHIYPNKLSTTSQQSISTLGRKKKQEKRRGLLNLLRVGNYAVMTVVVHPYMMLVFLFSGTTSQQRYLYPWWFLIAHLLKLKIDVAKRAYLWLIRHWVSTVMLFPATLCIGSLRSLSMRDIARRIKQFPVSY